MPDDIETFAARQRARRRKANGDAVLAVAGEAVTAALLLWFRSRYFPEAGALRTVLLILAILDFAIIIPILAVRRQRMKEIAGGEEDEARNY